MGQDDGTLQYNHHGTSIHRNPRGGEPISRIQSNQNNQAKMNKSHADKEAGSRRAQAERNDKATEELRRSQWQGSAKTKAARMECPPMKSRSEVDGKCSKEKGSATLNSWPVYHRSGKERVQQEDFLESEMAEKWQRTSSRSKAR